MSIDPGEIPVRQSLAGSMTVPKNRRHHGTLWFMAHLLGNTAPVFPFEYDLVLGEPIYACAECLPWYVEVVAADPDDHTDGLIVREWHAAECPAVPPRD